jgi:filamentous hemagglutinin
MGQAAQAQFWSLEDPATPGYAELYGIPPANVANSNFIETATLQPGTPYITRQAPAVGTNPGGGIEVVVPPGGVWMNYFGTH